MSQANVRSTEVLQDFRAYLGVFAEEVQGALGAVDMEVRRVTRWLQDEQGMYWQGELKRRKEKVSQARAELSRRKMSGMHGHSSSHSEQRDLVEEAQKRLREAEIRAEKVKKWIPALQQAVLEYHSTSRRLEGLVSGELPRAMAQIERVLDALEAYLNVAPPSGAQAAPPGAGAGFSSAARAGKKADEADEPAPADQEISSPGVDPDSATELPPPSSV